MKPVRWPGAAQPSSAHCWTPQHRHTNPSNHSPMEGKLPAPRNACWGGDLKSLKNASGWRTPVPKQWFLVPPNVPPLLTNSPRIGDTGCINSQSPCIFIKILKSCPNSPLKQIIISITFLFLSFMLKCSQTLIKTIAINLEILICKWLRSIYSCLTCKPTSFDFTTHLVNLDHILGRDIVIKKV